jgi:hypothetical protein
MRAAEARQRRHPAFSALLWGLAAFGGTQVALGLSVEAGWLVVNDPIFAGKAQLVERHAEAFRGTDQADRPLSILALGSSRTLFALEAGRLGACADGRE